MCLNPSPDVLEAYSLTSLALSPPETLPLLHPALCGHCMSQKRSSLFTQEVVDSLARSPANHGNFHLVHVQVQGGAVKLVTQIGVGVVTGETPTWAFGPRGMDIIGPTAVFWPKQDKDLLSSSLGSGSWVTQ
jgi:hypothetical protein